MYRHNLLFLTIILATFCVCGQTNTGSWTLYPTTSNTATNIVEDGDITYFLSGKGLASFDSSDQEIYYYTKANRLSDINITGIYYNHSKGYLLTAYENGNVDLVYPDGKVVNLPDLKDAILTTSHKINDIAFGFDHIFAATEFGIVVWDDIKMQVIESGKYGQSVDNIFIMGEKIMILTDNKLYGSDYNIRHPRLDTFSVCSTTPWASHIKSLNDEFIIFRHKTKKSLYCYKINLSTLSATNIFSDKYIIPENATFQQLADGSVMTETTDKILIIDSSAKITEYSKPSSINKLGWFTSQGLENMWVTTDEGFGKYDLSKNEYSINPFKFEGMTLISAHIGKFTKDNRLILMDTQRALGLGIHTEYKGYSTINAISSDGTVEDLTDHYYDLPDTDSNVNKWYSWWGGYELYGGTCSVTPDPDDPEVIYISNDYVGIVVMRGNDAVHRFDKVNAPMETTYGTRVAEVDFDNEGNMWVTLSYIDDQDYKQVILPAEKRKNDLENNLVNVTYDDWIKVPEFVVPNNRYAFNIMDVSGRYHFFSAACYEPGISVRDTNGTPTTFNDDKTISHTSFIDTEGNTLTTTYIFCMTLDKNNQIWVGTSAGIFIITDPSSAISSSMRVKRPLVPRNDGTNYGDYLLSSDEVYSISVDPSNRKWIGTNSGLYLVSEDGTEILDNYTTDNSILPSNTVYVVRAWKNENFVVAATADGTVSFRSDSSPGADDFSDVYAYPNPVRPDYTGWVTITGLMDNSLVKIADAAGNVLSQGTSEGGMYVWDVCNSSGRRVPTGVYFVFASENSSGSSMGAVTKILVVN